MAQAISESVIISAPVAEVWDYLSDSGNASAWSVYFDHITPLPGGVDGGLGALRRCFRRSDETGIRWDEEVVALDRPRRRVIHVFNVRGTRLATARRAEFRVTQLYEPLGTDATRLTFRVTVHVPSDAARRLLFWATHWETRRMFRLNLQNIRAAVEQGARYRRIHRWEPRNIFD